MCKHWLYIFFMFWNTVTLAHPTLHIDIHAILKCPFLWNYIFPLYSVIVRFINYA
jgi:hypothetical protein